jgi:hypothetical protein
MPRKNKKRGSRVLQGAREALAFARGDAELSAYRAHASSRKLASPRSSRLTAKQQDEVAALGALTDKRINTSDMPEVRDWSGARRGLFHRSSKRSEPSS